LIFLGELDFGKMTSIYTYLFKKKNRYRHIKESHYNFNFIFKEHRFLRIDIFAYIRWFIRRFQIGSMPNPVETLRPPLVPVVRNYALNPHITMAKGIGSL